MSVSSSESFDIDLLASICSLILGGLEADVISDSGFASFLRVEPIGVPHEEQNLGLAPE